MQMVIIPATLCCCYHHSSKRKRNSALKMALRGSYGLPPFHSAAFLSTTLFRKLEHRASNYDTTDFRAPKLHRDVLKYSLAQVQL